jgi:hypothetical protein
VTSPDVFTHEGIPTSLFGRIKIWLVDHVLTTDPFGALARLFFRDRIPSGRSKIDTGGKHIDDRTRAKVLWNIYERPEVKYIDRYLNPSLDVIELGGCLGVTGSHILQKLHVDRSFLSLEANPVAFKTLKKNLDLNAGGRAHRALLGAAFHPVTIAHGARLIVSDNIHTSTVVTGDGPGNELTTFTIPELRDHLESSRFTLVCDIEGSEWGFISQADRFLDGCAEMIIELHRMDLDGEHITPRDMIERLRSAGFDLVDHVGPVCYLRRAD